MSVSASASHSEVGPAGHARPNVPEPRNEKIDTNGHIDRPTKHVRVRL